MKLQGKTAAQINDMVTNGSATKAEAIEFLTDRVKTATEKFKAGTGRKPRYKSVKLLADLQGKTYEQVRDEFSLKAGKASKPSKSKASKPKASKPSHDQLDHLSVAYVEADVARLVAARTTKASIGRMNKGQIVDPLKVANLREAERRLGLIKSSPEPVNTSDSERIDALESKLDRLIAIFDQA